MTKNIIAKNIIAYSFDKNTKKYIGECRAWESPLESNIYHLPVYSTKIKPELKSNKKAFWRNEAWDYEEILPPDNKLPEIKESLEDKKNRIKSELITKRKIYLSSTDWYLLREFDQPNSYPLEIKQKRILARQEINQIKSVNSLAALSKFNTLFE